jgi:hypothetical protein
MTAVTSPKLKPTMLFAQAHVSEESYNTI